MDDVQRFGVSNLLISDTGNSHILSSANTLYDKYILNVVDETVALATCLGATDSTWGPQTVLGGHRQYSRSLLL